MEPTLQQDLTLGEIGGGYLKSLIEQHNLIENQVLTQEEAEKLLNHSYSVPEPPEIEDCLRRVMDATEAQRRQEYQNWPSNSHAHQR